MTHKQTQQWLTRGALAMMIAGACAVAWVALVSAEVSVSTEPAGVEGVGGDANDRDGAAGSGPTLQELRLFATKDLRRPLKDPPPVRVAPPPMQASLLGTIYEPARPEQSQALFRLFNGTQQFFKAGQEFSEPGGTVVVLEVGDQVARVEYREEERELRVAP
ncbi:MAG: hypothetical protein ACPGYV_15470 [Phycisphaeraceae bacterium]